MYKEEYYDYSGKEGKRIKEDLKNWGFHHLTISSLPADFFRMSKSQLEKLFEHASDAFIARMYDVPEYQVENRRKDFGIKQLMNTLNRMEREDETVSIFKQILRIVSNEYNNGNFPHTNSTPLNSEKEFLYMKATGIVRRIDDLGRVVIPKEIRRTMRIREGDPLEIYTDHDGEVIFKKYSPIGELHSFASSYAETLNKSCGLKVVICDRDTIIATAGVSKKEYAEAKISAEADELIENRSEYIWNSGDSEKFVTGRSNEKISVLSPIIRSGDIIGAVVSVSGEKEPADQMEIKMIQTAASFLSRQLEE